MANVAHKTSKTISVVILPIVAIASLALGLWLSQYLQNDHAPETTKSCAGTRLGPLQHADTEAATVFHQGKPLARFKLTDSNDKPFDLTQLRGKWSFFFFGYANCPDVCPMTLSTLNGVYRQLGKTPADLKNTQFVFISVDPDRDSTARLKKYAHFFNPQFLGATGKAHQIAQLARQVGAHYGIRRASTSMTDYTVTHSAQIILIDPQARERAVFPPPHSIDAITSAFRKIRHDCEGA